MNPRVFIILLTWMITSLTAFSQSPLGLWKTIDDEDGTAKSYVKIEKIDGKLIGKVHKLINPEKTICEKCKGDRKNKPIEGMIIMWNLSKDGDEWNGGKILDPKNGKEYKCKISLEDENTLNVRGFIGFSLLGRTQTWYRKIEE